MIDAKFYNLASELEEVERVRRVKLLEATSMDAVTFLPSHMGVVRAKVKELSKLKQKWGLEILEDDNGNRDVRIGDALRIIVPKEHWDCFQEMFKGELNNDAYLDLKDLLVEAMDDDLRDLRSNFKPVLVEMYNEERFNALDRAISVWQGRFGINRLMTNRGRVIVTPEHKERDIQQLYGKLLRVYKEDRGGLEMLIADMDNGRPLGAYDVFKRYDYLYGSRAVSDHIGVTLIFETSIDMTFITSESIHVGDEEVLDEIEDQVSMVKRVGDMLYPANERFDVGFFDILHSIIEEVDEQSVESEEEEDE